MDGKKSNEGRPAAVAGQALGQQRAIPLSVAEKPAAAAKKVKPAKTSKAGAEKPAAPEPAAPEHAAPKAAKAEASEKPDLAGHVPASGSEPTSPKTAMVKTLTTTLKSKITGKTEATADAKPAAKPAKTEDAVIMAATETNIKDAVAEVKPAVTVQAPQIASGKPARAAAPKPAAVKSAAAKPEAHQPATEQAAPLQAVPAQAAPVQATLSAAPAAAAALSAAPAAPAAAPVAAAPAPTSHSGVPSGPMRPLTPPRAMAKAEIFADGDFVVYPTHGVGKVERIATEEIAGHKLELIHITFDENRMTLRVPTNKARTAGLRKLASRKQFDDVLATLKGRARIKRTMWSRRAQEYEAKINSGDPSAIAEVVRDLHRNAGQPDQSFSERQIYESALDRLAAEYAALEQLDKPTAIERLIAHLKSD